MRVLALEPNKNMNTNLSRPVNVASTAIAARIDHNNGWARILPIT
jgi:hypothetical protein